MVGTAHVPYGGPHFDLEFSSVVGLNVWCNGAGFIDCHIYIYIIYNCRCFSSCCSFRITIFLQVFCTAIFHSLNPFCQGTIDIDGTSVESWNDADWTTGIGTILTRCQFWPPGVVACVRPPVRPSVTKFVRAITHHPFKLGSSNLDQSCKTPWLRPLLFWGAIDLDLQGQI